ncbi:FKBP-type peptidyl-prolyl cis-trans isomerase [Pseudomonadota bacterium]
MKQTLNIKTAAIAILTAALFMVAGCSQSDTGPAAENLAKGKAFLEANKSKEGVITLPSGVQYKVIVDGDGSTPVMTDNVKLHHRGRHLDGTIFDDSYKNNKPGIILVKHADPGMKKILQLMPVGSKWIVYVPPHMAYSNRGIKGTIEPNETLIYEIELLEIIW